MEAFVVVPRMAIRGRHRPQRRGTRADWFSQIRFRIAAQSGRGNRIAAAALKLPQHLWEPFLLAQAFSIPGWSAWAKYQSSWNDHAADDNNDLVGLLAIRLAYDVAIVKRSRSA